MDGRGRMAAILVSFMIAPAFAREPTALQLSWRDDAALYDVEFVSPSDGWGAGDHGSLWRTRDGGKTWSPCETGSVASWRSICRLTDQIGWVAGVVHDGPAEVSQPILLATRDGGKTWDTLPTESLSPLQCVRFTDLDEGFVVGEPTSKNPTGVWQTTDGGKSWNPLPGPAVRGWNAVRLLGPELGVLADRIGDVSLLVGSRLLPSQLPALSGRAIRGVTVTPGQRAWLVGEGGLVMTSPSGGVAWESPREPLPEEIRHLADFQAVAAVDDSVWIAGKPGGVIWHSPNAGRSWVRQATGITTPLNKLHFFTEKDGCAVGELGVILVTHDGGETWNSARGAGQHAAVLAIHAREDSYAPEVTAILSGEHGYRSVAWIATRTAERAGLSGSQRLQVATSSSGGSGAGSAWQLPLDVPGLELDAKRLESNWQRRTEGQLKDVLLGGIVREIRTWRPHVLLVDQPAPEDAAARLVYQATLLAVEQARDSTRYLAHRELGGLPPWNVERVYLNLLPGSTGTISLDPLEFLPRWSGNARQAAAPARALLGTDSPLISRPNFRWVSTKGEESQPQTPDLFSGMRLEPGGDVRRELAPIDDGELDARMKGAQRYRNVLAHATRTFDDPLLANQMLAQIGQITAGMTPEQAALTLHDLWTEHRQRGQYDLAEATAEELVKRFPDSPSSSAAARWLLACLVSKEVAWHRVRSLNQQQRGADADDETPAARRVRQISHATDITRLPDWKQHLPKALGLAQDLEANCPQIFQSPEMQLTLSALHRARNSHSQSDAVLRRNLTQATGKESGEWADSFLREVWLAQPTPEVPDGISACVRTESKPLLDGVLSDDCWQAAREWQLPFRTPPTMSDQSPLIMLACDAEYLYLAGSVQRIDGLPNDPPLLEGREHDADLRRHDRLCFRVDVDRDYATWYEFQVDQRGWTAESCWDNANWNPKWFVAVDGDASHWRVEIAIPWSELTPRAPREGIAWGLNLERIAPAVGRQSWLRPSPTQQIGSSFGVIRFE